jgi:hypothetical protein
MHLKMACCFILAPFLVLQTPTTTGFTVYDAATQHPTMSLYKRCSLLLTRSSRATLTTRSSSISSSNSEIRTSDTKDNNALSLSCQFSMAVPRYHLDLRPVKKNADDKKMGGIFSSLGNLLQSPREPIEWYSKQDGSQVFATLWNVTAANLVAPSQYTSS